jgi:hypothetical protein
MKIYRIVNRLFLNIGFDFAKFKNLIFFYKFLYDFFLFKKLGGKVNFIHPILGEHINSPGPAKSNNQYFYPDMIVASEIFKEKPKKHVDIGSRIDGFVSSVAVYRKIEIFDIRDPHIVHKNILFNKMDINSSKNISNYLEYTDSLSCLSVLEHIGLGRYGDKLDCDGHINAFGNIVKILKPEGLFYLSVPISEETKVYFNAHRSFNPKSLLQWSRLVTLEKFHYISDEGDLNENVDLMNQYFKKLRFGCGIYIFRKNKII